MISNNPDREAIGKIGGHVVKHMIEEVEEEMADGKHVSAGPSSEAEAKTLQNVRRENQKSADVSMSDKKAKQP